MLGIWRLKSRIDVDASGQRRIDPVMGADPLGMLCFSSGHFSAQFMRRDRAATAPSAPTAAGVNNSSAVNGYDAYFGTYTVDEAAGTITTVLEGAMAPANIGATFVRHVRVDGNQLTVSLPTTAPDGTPLTRTLKFTRLA